MRIPFLTTSTSQPASQQGPAPLVDPTPYYASPAFLTHAGQYAAIVQLRIRPGSNRAMDHTHIIEFLPTDPLAGVQCVFVTRDQAIVGDEKKRLITKNTVAGRQQITSSEASEYTSDEEKTADKIKVNRSELTDYESYELISGTSEPIIGFDIFMMVIADTRELIDEQIDLLNTRLGKDHDGALWASIAGEQLSRFQALFDRYVASKHDHTMTGSQWGGLNFFISPGLLDPNGTFLGMDMMSFTNSPALIDFNESITTTAMIAMPPSSRMGWYVDDHTGKAPAMASILAQSAANQIVSNHHRAFHLVFNDFDYLAKDSRFIGDPHLLEAHARSWDMATQAVNPLQGYGDRKDVTSIYARLIQKIVDIFDLLNDLTLDQADRAILLAAIDRFYIEQKLWHEQANEYLGRTRIVGVNPAQFPTMGHFINAFTQMAKRAVMANRELKADRIETLESILSAALSTHKAVLGMPTSITPDPATQQMFHFGTIPSPVVRQVQTVNTIEFILTQAQRGDAIILHGCDQLYLATMRMIWPALDAATKRGVRLLFTFDTITVSAYRGFDMANLFAMRGIAYNDLSVDVDLTLCGHLVPEELTKFETVMNNTFSETMRDQLLTKHESMAFIYRSQDRASFFVDCATFI